MSYVTYATTLIEPTKSALRIKEAALDSDQNVGASAWLRPGHREALALVVVVTVPYRLLAIGYWLLAMRFAG
jgi:hypothetical protein